MPNNIRTELHDAALLNNCDYFTKNKITPEELWDTYFGNTPLLWGIANSSVDFVLALLDLPDTTHVKTKSTNDHLNTPLILSVSKGWTHVATQGKKRGVQMDIARKLLHKGAEVNAVDADGRTALHYACLHRNVDAIKTLVEAGADWNIEDKNHQKPLDFCVKSYETASKILEFATGGIKDYTYTLIRDNFDLSDVFYQSLSSLYDQVVDVTLLARSNEFNQKIDCALAPIYNHAKILFAQCGINHPFEHYATNIMRKVSTDFLQIPDSIASRKSKSLLTIYFNLKNTASARMDFSRKEITPKKQEIEQIKQILNNALENPELMAERKLITRVSVLILNLVSILCAGLPLLANYSMTGQIFFSHQTKTEKLLNHFKDEIDRTQGLIQIN